jgi:hypothetical protein
MSVWWQLAIGIVVLRLVWRFVDKQLSQPEPSESLDEPRRGRPSSGVPSPKRRGPHNRSGAIALAEPNEENEGENPTFPPRTL